MATVIDATNAHSRLAAQHLDGAGCGFYGLIQQKKGQTRGRGAAKQRYGDDTVHAVFVGGISYGNAVSASADELAAMRAKGELARLAAKGYDAWSGRGKNAVQVKVTLADFEAAADELADSFAKSLAGTNKSTTGHVYEPLKVLRSDGTVETVRGARVYKCVAKDPNHECKCRMCLAERGTPDNRAPVDGQINILGMRIGQKVLVPAPNGPIPASKSGAKTVAKRVLRSRLKVGKIVSWVLEPNGEYVLRAGGDAAGAAGKDGVTIDPKALEAVEGLLRAPAATPAP